MDQASCPGYAGLRSLWLLCLPLDQTAFQRQTPSLGPRGIFFVALTDRFGLNEKQQQTETPRQGLPYQLKPNCALGLILPNGTKLENSVPSYIK